jgi:hypothetical protein
MGFYYPKMERGCPNPARQLVWDSATGIPDPGSNDEAGDLTCLELGNHF